jgi:hypothetical protein
MTLLGDVRYERAYYHCSKCHSGHFPTDAEFRLRRHQTPAATEVIALTGVLEPFAESAQAVLPRLSGLNLCASTIRRTTEAVGDDVALRRAAGETFGPEEGWEWHRDATGKTVAYVGLDATGVRQQGPHGEKAEGRMPWVGVVFNPQPTHERRRHRLWESRCVSGLMSLEEIGRQLRRECRAVGIARADRVVALTDGGNGLENCLIDVLSGQAREMVFILDFWHAAEHLREFANVWIAAEDARGSQVQAWCERLKHAGGRALLRDLEALELNGAPPAVVESHRQLLGYVQSNLHRMNYPRYVAEGWQIGSGKVESSCKSVVGQRLKGAGMRWRARGTTGVCQLRSLYKSEPECWRHYWKTTSPL